VQFRVDRNGRPDEGVYAQHAWAERCARPALRFEEGHPVVFVANGSHASYFTPAVHDRPWPDPNDHARGDGLVVRPRLVRITRTSPPWMRRSGPWGGSRAGFVPGEESSPRGPAFQRDRFDPAAFSAGARSCGSGAPPRPVAATVGLGAIALVFLGGLGLAAHWLPRRRRGYP
jgi:hypothetical protein